MESEDYGPITTADLFQACLLTILVYGSMMLLGVFVGWILIRIN